MRVLFGLLALASLLAASQIGPYARPPEQRAPAGTDCAVDGYVVNAVTSEPVPRAHIGLNVANGQSFVAADNSGRWSFSNIACGQIQITVNRPGFLNGNLGQQRISGTSFNPVVLTSRIADARCHQSGSHPRR